MQGERWCMFLRPAEVVSFMKSKLSLSDVDAISLDVTPARVQDFVMAWSPETVKEYAASTLPQSRVTGGFRAGIHCAPISPKAL